MDFPLDGVYTFPCYTTSPSTGSSSDADAAPTFEVFEETTDTDMGFGGSMTKRTSKTGSYRGQFTVSAANGFELGKVYSIDITAIIAGVTTKANGGWFRVVAAEGTAGYPVSDAVRINNNATAAVNLAISAGLMAPGTAITGTLSTTQATTDLSSTTDSNYVGRYIYFRTGALAGQSQKISAYNGTTKLLTFAAFTTAPSNGDLFIIV